MSRKASILAQWEPNMPASRLRNGMSTIFLDTVRNYCCAVVCNWGLRPELNFEPVIGQYGKVCEIDPIIVVQVGRQ